MQTASPSILVVDDIANRRKEITQRLAERDYTLLEAFDTEQALEILEGNASDLVITETELPARSGMYLLQEVKRRHPETEVILVTHNATSYNLLQALRHGAFDFIVRPIDTSEILFSVIDRAYTQIALRRQNRALMEELEHKNQALLQALDMIKALNVSIERINSAMEVGDILHRLVDSAIEALGARQGILVLAKADKTNFGIKICRGTASSFCRLHQEQLPKGLLLDLARRGKPLLAPSELTAPLKLRISAAEHQLFAHPGLIAVPLHHRNRTIGMLALLGHPAGSPFLEAHKQFLIQLAHHASLALEKSGIIHKLRRNGNGHAA